MIIVVKESKVGKVSTSLFNICAVSKSKIDCASTNMDILLPTQDLYLGRVEGTVGKKKFEKKYSKYLKKKNTYVEWAVYSIGRALASKPGNICFVCSDAEYELGYIQVLGETLAEMFGVNYETGYKEVKEIVDGELELFTKKERKAFNADDPDELDKKGSKMRKYVTKEINKQLRGSMSPEGADLLDEMDIRYAIDNLALTLINNGVLVLNKAGDSIKEVALDKFEGKTKDLVEVVMKAKEDEEFGDIVKAILKSYNLKYKYDAIKDLGKEKVIYLIGNLYLKLGEYRSGAKSFNDDN